MKKLLLANWKMNFTVGESTAFLTELLSGENSIRTVRGVETVLAPSFLALDAMRRADKEHTVGLCAQDAYFRQSGAYCSAISPRMLREVCDYVCLGHSERRIHFGDTNEILREKVRACEEAGLNTVLCVGESADERRLGLTEYALREQLCIALDGMQSPELLDILYEPVWALGTGNSLSAPEANEICALLRRILIELFGEAGRAVRVIYAGSVNPGNAASFAAQPEINGAAIGSAALRADSLSAIIRAFAGEESAE